VTISAASYFGQSDKQYARVKLLFSGLAFALGGYQEFNTIRRLPNSQERMRAYLNAYYYYSVQLNFLPSFFDC
jgi:hypothetical protein